VEQEWINLSEAAELLGVHPATIRAWADRGDLPMQRTAGGHRRFRRADVMARAVAQDRNQVTAVHIIIQSMLGRTRLEMAEGALHNSAWYRSLSDNARQQHRDLGHQLLHLVVAHISTKLADEEVMATAQQIGQDYALLGCANGLSLVETTRAYLFFRESLSQTIYDMIETSGAQSPTDWRRIRQQIVCLTNEVLLALIGAYETLNVERGTI
jgi:excisionase family DNA binding protein